MLRLVPLAATIALATPAAADNYLFAGCTEQNNKIVCENLDLTEAPEGIPDGFARLLMKDNAVHSNGGDEPGTGELNALSIANVANHPSIRELELQRNGILSIAAGTFSGFGDLTVLKLFGNLLETITANAFDGLTSLQTLYINNNLRLWKINSGAFSAMAGTLSELFAKDCPLLGVVEDGSLNQLTFRPLFIDMTNDGSMCMVPPFGATECICGNGGVYNDVDGINAIRRENSGLSWLINDYSTLSWVGGSSGFCEVETANPTAAPATSEPTSAPTAAPATSEPTTSPATSAPTPTPTPGPTTPAPTTATPTAEAGSGDGESENRQGDDDDDSEQRAPSGGKSMGSKGGFNGLQIGVSHSKSAGKGQSSKGESGFILNFRVNGSTTPSSRLDSTTVTSKANPKIGKMSGGTVSYQPIGDLKSNIDLNGSPTMSIMVASGFVVLIAAAAFHRRKYTKGYTQVDPVVTTPVRPERKQLDGLRAESHYDTFSASPMHAGPVLV